MVLIDGKYVDDTITEEQVRWAMHLAVLSLQGAANVQDWETYCNKVAEGAMHILATHELIKNELDI